MRFGFHVSIAGGFTKAAQRARKLQCRTVQIFSHNPRGWSCKTLNEKDVSAFKESLAAWDIKPLIVHMPYLPNPASPDKKLYEKSVCFLSENLTRAHSLGAQALVAHPGSCGTGSPDDAIKRISTALSRAIEQADVPVRVLLENTAGQGTELGCTFSQLMRILEGIPRDKRVGICLDTAHAFAAGYDMASSDGLEKTLRELDTCIGIDRLHVLHLNDAKAPCGSHSDRHWHIGRGHIGLAGFRRIVNHRLLRHLPGIMETPKKEDNDDFQNMLTITGLVAP